MDEAQIEKYASVISHKVKQEIGKWMLETYPKFDERLEYKIEKLTKIRDKFENFFEDLEKRKDEIEKSCIGAVLDYLTIKYPDFGNSVQLRLDEVNSLIKNHLKVAKERDELVKEKLKKLNMSSSLADDVYQIKDRLKEIDDKYKKFSDALKKVFK